MWSTDTKGLVTLEKGNAMNNILKMVLSCLIIIGLVMAASAQMPQELKGSWSLNAPKTEAYMKTSPKWKNVDERYLRIILNKMAQIKYVFTEDTIVVSTQGKKQSIPVVLKKSEPQKYTFEGTMLDKVFIMTVSFFDKTTIHIRSSLTDDTDYLLWSRKMQY